MIFLSHKSDDKLLIEPFANALAAAYGRESVFYDSWSIQPGDGIIDRMNQGLEAAKFLVLFISQRSLNSRMVSLEWQSALFRSVKGNLKIIPVRLDQSPLPPILANTLYIDFPSQGLDNSVRQVVDVVASQNTYRPPQEPFQNVRAYLTRQGENGAVIEIRTEAYMEPHSRYFFLFRPTGVAPTYRLTSDGMCQAGFNPGISLEGGEVFDGQLIAVSRPTSIGFPVVVEFDDVREFAGILRAVTAQTFVPVPVIHQ